MSKDVILSVIIPVYNVEKYLDDCIDSLYTQDIDTSEYEVIMINDGSTDKSYEIAKELAKQHDNIILLTQENSGQSVARNKGLDIARGKYIMFVDSDDKLMPNVMGKLLSTMTRHQLDICAYRIIYEDESGKEIFGAIQPFPTDEIFDGRYAITHGADIGSLWQKLYLKEMIDRYQLRFINGIYHQDVDFNLRMFAYANRMMFTDVIGYWYRFVAGSSVRKPNKQREFKLIKDDFIVVRHIRDFSIRNEYGKRLAHFYRKHGNSIVISRILELLRTEYFDNNEKSQLLFTLKELNLYPIKGRTLSWKTTLLIPFINNHFLLKRLLR